MTEVIICCGVGGVGKTTTAAALSLSLALAGKRVVVLTIDPARRLSDALGLARLGNKPSLIDLPLETSGSLHALMLDQKQTWDEVIRRFSISDEATERLLANPYYQAISERLTGSHEYMAVEKLYDLVSAGHWDIVVVDTPPAQHTLDFFRAPDRIQKILNRTALRTFIEPNRGLVGAATSGVMSVFKRIAGESVLGDIQEFFEILSGLSSGFLERSEAVKNLLSSQRTTYYLVAAAAEPNRSNFLDFLGELRGRNMKIGGFILNRHHPAPEISDLTRPAPPLELNEHDWAEYWNKVVVEVQRHQDRHSDQVHRANEMARVAKTPIWLVPDFGQAISTIGGLSQLAKHLPPRAKPNIS